MPNRLFRALAAALLVAGFTVTSASAGGWATINADKTNPPQPHAGVPFTFGFTVLQHGVTPAGWVHPTFVGINVTSGARIEAKATGQGADGHFVATVTLPSAGNWTWQVDMPDLMVETAPQALVVATATGKLPAVDTPQMLAALQLQRDEIRADYEARLAAQADALHQEMTQLSTQIKVLESQRDTLDRKVTQLEAGSAVTPATPAEGLPLIAVILIAVLAGAISGFVIAYLGRSGTPATGATDGSVEERIPSSGALPSR
jgi:hypothetical protein